MSSPCSQTIAARNEGNRHGLEFVDPPTPQRPNRRTRAEKEVTQTRGTKHDSAFSDAFDANAERATQETLSDPVGHGQEMIDNANEVVVQYDEPEVAAATPQEFGDLFPSSRKISIRHDDTTFDGNFNLTLETSVSLRDGTSLVLTMFHLKMQDLERRMMSFRRYSRYSGREVCNTTCAPRKAQITKRPTLKKSFSSALANLKLSMPSKMSVPATPANDEFSEAGDDEDGDEEENESDEEETIEEEAERPDSSEISLDFSNYAHLKLSKRHKKKRPLYEFKYWGTRYTWTVNESVSGSNHGRTYQLLKADSTNVLANIVPQPQTAREAHLEDIKGGWVSPSLFWIDDENIARKADVAE